VAERIKTGDPGEGQNGGAIWEGKKELGRKSCHNNGRKWDDPGQRGGARCVGGSGRADKRRGVIKMPRGGERRERGKETKSLEVEGDEVIRERRKLGKDWGKVSG